MGEPKEKYFLEFNQNQIGDNLSAAEVHARNLTSDMGVEHSACIFKHLGLVADSASEGISHSMVVDKDKSPMFQELLKETEAVRKTLRDTRDPEVIIPAIRGLKKIAGRIDPAQSLKDCKVCGVGGSHTSSDSFINPNPQDTYQKVSTMNIKETIVEVAGGVVVAKAADYAIAKVSTLSTNAQIARVGIGLASLYFGSKGRVPGGAMVKDSLKAGGVFMLTRELYNYVTTNYTSQYGFGRNTLAFRQSVPAMSSAQVVRGGGGGAVLL